MKSSLISVVIPAYNLIDYTEKTIKSVIEQTHRPIEIILSDDCSPQSLKPMTDRLALDSEISFKYFRQPENLNYYWNLKFCLTKATGEYIITLDHDDWFVDTDFFSNALNQFRLNKNCAVAIGNTFFENTFGTHLKFNFDNWNYINGRHFLKYDLFKMMPCTSAIIYNHAYLKKLNYIDYFVDKSEVKGISYIPDEGYTLLCLLLAHYDITLTGRAVNVRGTPENSLSQSKLWSDAGNRMLFFAYNQIAKYYKSIGFTDGYYTMALSMVYRYPIIGLNYQLLSYFKFEPGFVCIILLSNLIFIIKKILSFPALLLSFLKIQAIKIVRFLTR
tara:strand:+ start:282 stop:1274 length:993 start_codon:yes stop_codon:yes gene_type:complete